MDKNTMEKPMRGTWCLVTPDGNRYHGETPLKCCKSEQEDRVTKDLSQIRQLELFCDLTKKKSIKELWRKPDGSCPEGHILVEVDLRSGESDVAFVFIDDDCQTLIHADGAEDVYTEWCWCDVSRYLLLEDILVKER